MFQICVLEPKISKEKTSIMFLKLFQNAMIRNIKIHNIFYIIKISKNMEPNKCIILKIMKMFCLNVSYDFSKLNGSKKIKMWHFLVVPPNDVLFWGWLDFVENN
jgi:hypothetical protein